MKLIAVNFHYIRNDFSSPHPGIYGRTPIQFQRQLETLSSLAPFISQGDIKTFLKHGKQMPDKAFIVTFDDGLREQYELALPILKQMGIPAVFFVNTKPLEQSCVLNVHKIHLIRSHRSAGELLSFLDEILRKDGIFFSGEKLASGAAMTYRYDPPKERELKYLLNFLLSPYQRDKYVTDIFNRIFENQLDEIHDHLYMTAEQIKVLSRDDMLGCHGLSHQPLGFLPPPDRKKEVIRSKKLLEKITGRSPYSFGYPYGGYDAVQGADTVVKDAGFVFAFTMERAVNDHCRFPFLLSRFDTNDLPGGKLFNQNPGTIFEDLPNRKWFQTLADKGEL